MLFFFFFLPEVVLVLVKFVSLCICTYIDPYYFIISWQHMISNVAKSSTPHRFSGDNDPQSLEADRLSHSLSCQQITQMTPHLQNDEVIDEGLKEISVLMNACRILKVDWRELRYYQWGKVLQSKIQFIFHLQRMDHVGKGFAELKHKTWDNKTIDNIVKTQNKTVT